MLKNILNLNGVQQLTKEHQQTINGGIIDKCCVRIPGDDSGDTGPWCNSNTECKHSKCYCGNMDECNFE